MVTSVKSPADVVNLALVRIGYKLRIGNLYDGSAASKKALDIYSQTRDEVLRQNDWGFAERNVSLTLLKQAPEGGYFPPVTWSSDFPPPPWVFEYAYPSDCLKVRAVKPVPMFTMTFDPQPHVYSVENDQSLTPAAKVILCNIPNAILTYTGQVTDPADWEADFVEVLASALGRRLAPVLTGLDAAKLEASDESASMIIAEQEQG
ncbi:hypothetical protein FHT86_002143 [Rhizobium sp. BK313]|uniref:hypothetical protein n=1 Tax=Rhizobium sp. BK313 TaxID=2587081 RepID=UPI001614135E|nr:hypothetical protein [Rhizobium sp. BK313]MBB3453887.1 hypothetical protein [Rhizobium sp. BK313]